MTGNYSNIIEHRTIMPCLKRADTHNKNVRTLLRLGVLLSTISNPLSRLTTCRTGNISVRNISVTFFSYIMSKNALIRLNLIAFLLISLLVLLLYHTTLHL